MRKKSLLTLISLVFLASGPAWAGSAGVIVMELFTSQGCPACPPADALFQGIAQNYDEIIALGCHVTYFNRGGRSDPMSQDFCDARQGSYRSAGVTGKVYTPQVIINGRAEAVGSRRESVLNGIARAGGVPPLGLAVRNGGLDIYLPSMKLERPADVWLFGYDRMRSGYNRGRTVSYAHPVTHLTKLLRWDGRAANMSFPLDDFSADGYAIIVQDADGGKILAAGKARR